MVWEYVVQACQLLIVGDGQSCAVLYCRRDGGAGCIFVCMYLEVWALSTERGPPETIYRYRRARGENRTTDMC